MMRFPSLKMKKLPLLIAFVLILSLGVIAFAGCGDEPETQPDTTIYNVTSEESPYYDVNGTYRATAGTTAEISIDLEFPDACTIANVQFNGQDCTKVDDTNYTFTMPAQNVEITVTLNWIDTPSDSYLSWADDVVTSLVSAKNDDNYYHNFDMGEIEYTYSGNYQTDADITILSTNQNVIPNEAIVNEFLLDNQLPGNSNGSNEIVGGTLEIDRSLINAGTTQIIFTFQRSFTTSYAIVITITVTE